MYQESDKFYQNMNHYAGNTYEAFELYLSSQFDLYYSPEMDYYCPYVSVIQSSGMGKTRLMYELVNKSTEFNTAYICIRPKLSDGDPPRMNILSDLICSLSGDRQWFLFIISFIQSFNELVSYDVLDLENDSILGRNTKLKYETFINNTQIPNFSLETDVEIRYIRTNFTFINAFKIIKECFGSKNRLVIVIDEITTILTEGKAKFCSFLSFRRALLAVSVMLVAQGIQIMSVVLDTNAEVTNLAPSKFIDPSRRARISGDHLLHPFICLANFGVLKFDEALKDCPRYHHHRNNLRFFPPNNDFQLSLNIFKLIEYGRPLFTESVIKDFGSISPFTLFDVERTSISFAILKLKMLPIDTIEMSTALICSRIGISIFAKDLSECLTKSMLATCQFIDDDRQVIFASYRTEPLLAEASAHLMNDSFKIIIRNFCSIFLNSFSQDKGVVGETVAAVLCLNAVDSAALKNYDKEFNIKAPQFIFCRPISVKSFLSEMTDFDLLMQEISDFSNRRLNGSAAIVIEKITEDFDIYCSNQDNGIIEDFISSNHMIIEEYSKIKNIDLKTLLTNRTSIKEKFCDFILKRKFINSDDKDFLSAIACSATLKEGVSKEEFIKEICSQFLKRSPLKLDDFLLNALMTVNNVSEAEEHFSQKYLANMQSYSSIVWGTKNQPGFDFAIPITLPNGTCSSILIQVKNHWKLCLSEYKNTLKSALKVMSNIIPPGYSTLILIINMGAFNETIPKLNSIIDSFGVEHIVIFLSPFAERNGILIADPSFFPCCDKESKTKLVSLCIRCEDEAEKSFGSVYDSMREKLPKDTDLFKKLNSNWLRKSFR